ncbi:GerAB/ArcD/ProY family transporter [Paenibacillus sp. CGMCC 1.16610]|uniref:GerAB/ArcD/ProY family transporter n=1 Tax=Paenibacillus anseongense TaxID=2682845 RepID=A0ABW9UMU7_9BACL|nr:MULTISPECIES: GerAB/ArcD/ProY family transporter [Paenibacillus]MBA2941029.1 GerAB/ArcD/ProY family transporter [Paenibacillus sp. CGMCC 1.16610]MVQ39850.1 GerAB/ArcD/ProY family transporter [Paenibacillus anseongense]
MNKNWALAPLFFAVHLSLIFFLYPDKMIGIAHFGHWAYISAGIALEFAFLWLLMSGLAAAPGSSLTGLFRNWGAWTARLLLFPLSVYWFMSLLVGFRIHAETLIIMFLPRTPEWAVLFVLVLLSLQASLISLRGLSRATVTLLILLMPILLFSLGACFLNADARYLMPLTPNLTFWHSQNFLNGLASHSCFLFIGMASAKWDFSARCVRRSLYVAMATLIPFYFLAVYIPLLIFSPGNANKFRYPLTAAFDTVNIDWLMLDRITMLYVVGSVTFIYIFGALLIRMNAELLRDLFLPVSKSVLSCLLAALAFSLALLVPNWHIAQNILKLDTPLRLYSEAIIPLLASVIGKLTARRRAQ